MATYEGTKRGYQNLWGRAELDPHREAEITRTAEKILANKDRYWAVEMATGVPWFWIACVHYRESSLDFRGVLHNGQPIIGTGELTTIEPTGRGPFGTWEEAAIDAVTTPPHALQKIDDWPVARCLYEFERYNGWGYMGRENSPYVWAGTTLSDETGKYVRDGVYDANAPEKQLGCAALLIKLVELDASVAERLDMAPPSPQQPGAPSPAPVQPAPDLDAIRVDDLIAAIVGREYRGARIRNVMVEYSEAEPPEKQ